VIGLDIEGNTDKTEGGQYYLTGPKAPPPSVVASRLQELGYKAAIATSWNHLAPSFKGGDIGPRYRVLLDPEVAIHPDDYEGLVLKIAKDLRIEEFVDWTGTDSNRLFYLPTAPEERIHLAEAFWIDGSKVPAELIPPIGDRPLHRADGDGRRKGSLNPVARAFCEVTDIRSVLLRNGYRENPNDDSRFVRPGGAGGGVVVLGEGDPDCFPVVYTHHSNDRIPQGKALDAFELVATLEFQGDRDAAHQAASNDPTIDAIAKGIVAQAFNDGEGDDSPNPGIKKKSFQETEVIFGDREEPIEYIVDGFFESGVGVLAGAPGGGKTNAMVPFSLIAAGLLEAPGLKAEVRRKVVYISEHPSQVGRILKSIKRANPGIDKAELRDWFKVFPSARRSLSEVAKILEVVKAEYSYTDACGYLVRPLVIFDTASACFNLENENDNSQVAEVIATLKAANIPILVVAHTPKALKRADLDQLTVRGGGAWEGDAHQVFFLFEDEAIGRRVIGISKVRFLPAFWEIHFGLSEPFDEIVEVPWDGQAQRVTFVHGVPEIGSREERQEARAELAEERRDDKKEKAILEKMNQVIPIIETTVGRGAWISRGGIRETLKGNAGVLVEAITRLIDRGVIEEIGIPESIYKSGGTKAKALTPAGLDPGSYWARVAEIAKGKAGT
jgi:hypothetical protein